MQNPKLGDKVEVIGLRDRGHIVKIDPSTHVKNGIYDDCYVLFAGGLTKKYKALELCAVEVE